MATINVNATPAKKAPKPGGKRAAIKQKKQIAAQMSARAQGRQFTNLEKQQLSEVRREIAGLKLERRLKRSQCCSQTIELVKQTIQPGAQPKPVRYPDGLGIPTAVVLTKTIVNVAPNTATGTATADQGRFAFVIHPSLGLLPPISGTGTGNSNFGAGALTASRNPLSSSLGNAFKVGNFIDTQCMAVNIDPSKTWDPSTSWDNGAWQATRDSQGAALYGSPGTGAGANWNTGYTSGIARSSRAVAQSVHFRCSESQLQNGGNVATALVTQQMLGTICPIEGPQATTGGTFEDPGNLLYWENLADYPYAKSGNLRKGTYCWRKFEPGQLQLPPVDPTVGQQAPEPWIVVAGQAQPSAPGAAFPANIGVIEIYTVYEIQTNEQWVEKKLEPYNSQVLDEYWAIIATLPTAMENDEHVAWYQRVLRFLTGAGAAGLTFATTANPALAITAGLGAAQAAKNLF